MDYILKVAWSLCNHISATRLLVLLFDSKQFMNHGFKTKKIKVITAENIDRFI